MALVVGSRLGPYHVVSAIGAGGMGEVYRATDARLRVPLRSLSLPWIPGEESRTWSVMSNNLSRRWLAGGRRPQATAQTRCDQTPRRALNRRRS